MLFFEKTDCTGVYQDLSWKKQLTTMSLNCYQNEPKLILLECQEFAQ